MVWKVERWLTDLFPGEQRVFDEYEHLPGRELIIVACAVLDAALVELLSRRLLDLPSEAENFLGTNGDGRAPAGTFGCTHSTRPAARPDSTKSARLMRHLKTLRNIFAHRVRVDFKSEAVVRVLRSLGEELHMVLAPALVKHGGKKAAAQLQTITDKIGTTPETGEALCR